ncbi:MAG: GNAT family N-acetyltransferase [Victivallaceae bacterium]|nr:GNAT family N-acetyltransferase [Victivallaceae bacterium]
MDNFIQVRKALPDDVDNICTLMKLYAAAQIVLPRDSRDVLEHLDNFWIGITDNKFAGCVAVRDFGNRLFEIRSLAVNPEMTGQRVGSTMIKKLITHFSEQSEPCRLFALTYRANFFSNLGFSLVNKEMFPGKIWSDCSKCPKKDHCDEDALLLELLGQK